MIETYKHQFNQKFGFKKDQSHTLPEIARLTGFKLAGLKTIYSKGLGAFRTSPESVRPNVLSAPHWAQSRVYSAVMGGKASIVDKAHLIRT
jgi:hypothetical protein